MTRVRLALGVSAALIAAIALNVPGDGTGDFEQLVQRAPQADWILFGHRIAYGRQPAKKAWLLSSRSLLRMPRPSP